MTDSFRLDRRAFHMGTHEETEYYYARNQPKTFAERLQAATYLNSIAFRYDITDPPRLDRMAFSARKHENG